MRTYNGHMILTYGVSDVKTWNKLQAIRSECSNQYWYAEHREEYSSKYCLVGQNEGHNSSKFYYSILIF